MNTIRLVSRRLPFNRLLTLLADAADIREHALWVTTQDKSGSFETTIQPALEGINPITCEAASSEASLNMTIIEALHADNGGVPFFLAYQLRLPQPDSQVNHRAFHRHDHSYCSRTMAIT